MRTPMRVALSTSSERPMQLPQIRPVLNSHTSLDLGPFLGECAGSRERSSETSQSSHDNLGRPRDFFGGQPDCSRASNKTLAPTQDCSPIPELHQG